MTRPPVDPINPMAKALAASAAADHARLCRGAEALAAALPPGGALFNQTWIRKGCAPVLVMFTWPGVLMTLDPEGGEIIRETEAADMHADARDAARFMASKARGKPLKAVTFQPPQGQRLRASVWPDGVVRVHAIKGRELLAESEPGQPYTLRAGFRSLTAQDLAPRID